MFHALWPSNFKFRAKNKQKRFVSPILLLFYWKKIIKFLNFTHCFVVSLVRKTIMKYERWSSHELESRKRCLCCSSVGKMSFLGSAYVQSKLALICEIFCEAGFIILLRNFKVTRDAMMIEFRDAMTEVQLLLLYWREKLKIWFIQALEKKKTHVRMFGF